ncbi:GNAT family N-acetyltransferase [Candidatus Woesebacteria bacterium]|nr:GNAT family N-acetyltransferase [Candidatus Woesebacteria bacterium]
MKIVPIEVNNFKELFNLWEAASLHVASEAVEQSDFLKIMQLNPETCLKVVIDNTIVASSLGTWNGRRAWVYHFAVHPDYQRQNIGTALLNETLRQLRTRGATKVIVGVEQNNQRAKQFYRNVGFEVMDDAELMVKEV